jgi:hypothetical protein
MVLVISRPNVQIKTVLVVMVNKEADQGQGRDGKFTNKL